MGGIFLLDWRVWTMAARPKTLPAAAAPVIVGSALAFRDGGFHPGGAAAALICALLLQIGSNLANDVYDYQRGADSGERLGPSRVTQAGLLTPKQVKLGMAVVFASAGVCGLYLSWISSWYLLVVGLLAILAAISYSGGPLPFGYHGLGDLFVLLFFGLVAVSGTYYVQVQKLTFPVFAMSLAVGALINNILVVNNLRDISLDQKAGKKTLAVLIGPDFTRVHYVINLLIAYIIPPALVVGGWAPRGSWLILVSLPFSLKLIRGIYQKKGKELNQTLAETGLFSLIYAVLFSLGWVAGF